MLKVITRDIILIAILVVVLFLFYKSCKPSKYDDEIKDLNAEISNIQKERDSLARNIKNLEVTAQVFRDSIVAENIRIKKTDSQLVTAQGVLMRSKQNAVIIYKNYTNDNAMLTDFINHPVKKTGDSLLQDLQKIFN